MAPNGLEERTRVRSGYRPRFWQKLALSVVGTATFLAPASRVAAQEATTQDTVATQDVTQATAATPTVADTAPAATVADTAPANTAPADTAPAATDANTAPALVVAPAATEPEATTDVTDTTAAPDVTETTAAPEDTVAPSLTVAPETSAPVTTVVDEEGNCHQCETTTTTNPTPPVCPPSVSNSDPNNPGFYDKRYTELKGLHPDWTNDDLVFVAYWDTVNWLVTSGLDYNGQHYTFDAAQAQDFLNNVCQLCPPDNYNPTTTTSTTTSEPETSTSTSTSTTEPETSTSTSTTTSTTTSSTSTTTSTTTTSTTTPETTTSSTQPPSTSTTAPSTSTTAPESTTTTSTTTSTTLPNGVTITTVDNGPTTIVVAPQTPGAPPAGPTELARTGFDFGKLPAGGIILVGSGALFVGAQVIREHKKSHADSMELGRQQVAAGGPDPRKSVFHDFANTVRGSSRSVFQDFADTVRGQNAPAPSLFHELAAIPVHR